MKKLFNVLMVMIPCLFIFSSCEEDKKYTVYVSSTEYGTVTTDAQEYLEGAIVNLTVTPDENYELDKIRAIAEQKNIDITNNKFTMPAANVVIVATFKEKIDPNKFYTVKVASVEHGDVFASPSTCRAGTQVSLRILPDPGYVVDNIIVSAGQTIIPVEDNKFTMPAGDVIVTAIFKSETTTDTYIVTIAPTENGSVSSAKAQYKAGEEVRLTVIPDANYELGSITVLAGADNIPVVDNKFTMPAANVVVIATFRSQSGEMYTVTIAPTENGSVSSAKAQYKAGEEVRLTVIPDANYELGSITVLAGADNIPVVDNKFTMPAANVTVIATFNLYGQSGDYDFTPTATIDGYEYVDLGLSVMWATCNVGATSKEKIGNYFAWQETTPWTTLTAVNYNLYFNPCNPATNILSSKYDAARMNWGKNWRMPNYNELDELCKNCYWEFVDNFQGTGVAGCIIKSKSSPKAIFMPVTGYKNYDNNQISQSERGHYWCAYGGPGDFWKGLVSALSLTFYQGQNFKYGGTWGTGRRADGLVVRAVVGQAEEYIPEGPFPLDNAATSTQGVSVNGKKDGYTYVDLGLPSRTLWATYNVGASSPKGYGNYYAWGETTPKATYTNTNYKFYAGVYGTWNRYNKYTWLTEHHGTIDGKFILDPEDDAATQNMSANWHMPTKAQIQELCNYVEWTEKSSGTLKYYEGKSKTNGLTIILPCGGWEYGTNPNAKMMAWYWSSELMEASKSGSDYYAYQLIDAPDGESGLMVKDAMRIQGLSVRGVTKK